jgi:hypothetical protein
MLTDTNIYKLSAFCNCLMKSQEFFKMSVTKFVASRIFSIMLQFQQKWHGVSSIYFMKSMALKGHRYRIPSQFAWGHER